MENAGPSAATNVVVTDILPPGVTIVPAFPAKMSQGEMLWDKSASPADPVVYALGTINAGGTASIQLDVLVDPSLPPGTVLTNEVYVTSDNFDMDNSDNRAVSHTVVNTWADMEITKLSVGDNITGYDTDLWRFIYEELPGQATAGLGLRYEISVQNNGPSDAQNVQVLDLLPGQDDTGLTHDPIAFSLVHGGRLRAGRRTPGDRRVRAPAAANTARSCGAIWGLIPVGARKTFYVYVRVEDTVPNATILTNGAFVWWGACQSAGRPGRIQWIPVPAVSARVAHDG